MYSPCRDTVRAVVVSIPVCAALGAGTACVDTSCGRYVFQDEPAGEWCGPNGSFGFLFIDEGMAQIFLEPHRELGDYNVYYDSIPFWHLHFRDFQLETAQTLAPEDLDASCSYFPLIGSGQGLFTFPATSASLTVHGPTGHVQTGGLSWRLTWEVVCETNVGTMTSEGTDIIELGLTASGYEGSGYAVPPDRDPVSP